jgi:hypothetical protein
LIVVSAVLIVFLTHILHIFAHDFAMDLYLIMEKHL